MSELLIHMAQQAGRDKMLCAQWIQEYGERHSLGWDEIAACFGVDRQALARLALCRQPSQSKFAQEADQIADFLSVDRNSVVKFFQSVNEVHAARPSGLRPVLQLRTDMFRKFSWALAVIAVIILFSAFIDFRAVPSAATLVVTAGQVTVQASGDQEQIVAAGRAITVSTGDSIQLAHGAAAHLRLRGGSTVDLAEEPRSKCKSWSRTGMPTVSNSACLPVRPSAGLNTC